MKYLLIAIAAALLFVPFTGGIALQDPLSLYYTAAAKATLPGGLQPFPLYGWVQAGSLRLFGNTAFAAYFPNAIIAIITLLTFYGIGKKQADERFGTWWALVYASCWLPFLVFRSALPDPLFNYLFFLSVYFMYRIAYSVKPIIIAALSGLCLGLAMLIKGPLTLPLALLLLLGYWVASKGKTGIKAVQLLIFILLACLPVAAWLVYNGVVQGWATVQQFFSYQAALLFDPWPRNNVVYYMVLLPGCFPAVLFLLGYLYAKRRSIYNTGLPLELKEFKVWMWLFFWIVLLLAPATLYIIPLSFLAAWQVYRVSAGRQRLRSWHIVLLMLTGILIGLVFLVAVLAGVYKTALAPYMQAPFMHAFLQLPVTWQEWEVLYGVLYIVLVSYSGVLLFRRKYQEGLLCLFVGSLLFAAAACLHFGPKVLF